MDESAERESSMKHPTLFDVPEQKSPRLLWMEKHGISTEKHGPDDDGNTWTAFRRFRIDDNPYYYQRSGKTEDEALSNLAMTSGLQFWNEEPV